MVDHFKKLFIAQIAIHFNRIPKLFIHMVAGDNFGVALAQFNGQFRIALYIKLVSLADAGKQEDLFADFKHQRILAERKALRYAGFSQAIFAKFFQIQWLT